MTQRMRGRERTYVHSYMRAHVRTYYDGRNTNVTYARTHTLVRTYVRKALDFFAMTLITTSEVALASWLMAWPCASAPGMLLCGCATGLCGCANGWSGP